MHRRPRQRDLTYSGPDSASQWKPAASPGASTPAAPGPEDDIVYAIQGNILTGAPVVA
jgi:hypothetical protein